MHSAVRLSNIKLSHYYIIIKVNIKILKLE